MPDNFKDAFIFAIRWFFAVITSMILLSILFAPFIAISLIIVLLPVIYISPFSLFITGPFWMALCYATIQDTEFDD